LPTSKKICQVKKEFISNNVTTRPGKYRTIA
jgi:hypothetical protein